MNNTTPYNRLEPDIILNAIENVGWNCTGSLLALNSYENRVYQIGIEDENPIIAKFYRPNRWTDDAILEEHQFAAELTALEIPVVAPLINQNQTLHHSEEFRFALFPRKGGRALELDNAEQLEWMGRFLGRLHAVGSCRPFKHRHVLTVKQFGYQSLNFLLEQHFLPDHLKESFEQTARAILERCDSIFMQTGDIKTIRLHGDCHIGNILWREEGPHIVDLDDCMMGPAVQDLWMLLSSDPDQSERQLQFLLRGYTEFHDFNYRELRLIEVLRSLRMLHYSAWLAKRWEDPAFPRSFPWFNTGYYWQEQLGNLNVQRELLELC